MGPLRGWTGRDRAYAACTRMRAQHPALRDHVRTRVSAARTRPAILVVRQAPTGGGRTPSAGRQADLSRGRQATVLAAPNRHGGRLLRHEDRFPAAPRHVSAAERRREARWLSRVQEIGAKRRPVSASPQSSLKRRSLASSVLRWPRIGLRIPAGVFGRLGEVPDSARVLSMESDPVDPRL